MPLATDTIDRLKAATRSLVRKAGGPGRCLEIARGGQVSRFSEYGAPHHPDSPDRFIAIDQVATLEADVGEPVVARLLADLRGFDLVPQSALAASPKRLHDHLARIILETADLQAKAVAAIADGTLTHAERASVAQAIDKVVADLHALKAQVAPPLRTVGKGEHA